ncbi:TPA: OmpA family protein [Vibrio parahaemolyticus]
MIQKRLLIILTLSSYAMSGHAQDYLDDLSVGAGLGFDDYHQTDTGSSASIHLFANQSINENLNIEAGYLRDGRKLNNLYLSAQLGLPYKNMFYFGEVGELLQATPFAGFGIKYPWSRRLDITAKYDFLWDVSSQADEAAFADVGRFSLAVSYHFGVKEEVTILKRVSKPRPTEVAPPPPTNVVLQDKSVSGRSLFDSSSASITPTPELLSLVQTLIQHSSVHVTITGFTDSSGPEAFNLQLSQKRAQSVADYMVKRGVKTSRLTVQGLGEAKPIADNDTPEGRAKNRRVEIKFSYPEMP